MALTFAASLAVILLASSSSLAAAAPNVLGLRQETASCTSSSFTIPSWYVRDLKTGSAGDASFVLQNRATGLSIAQACKASGGVWSCAGSSVDLKVALSVQSTQASVQVQQTWACSDRNPDRPITFTASGNATIPLSCVGVACKSSNPVDLVRGTLHAPVELYPAYAEGPPGHSRAGCNAVSEKPKWTLGTIIFINETGYGDGAVATQSIQFQVTNQANGYVAGCLNYFNAEGDEDPAIVMNCGGGADFARRNRYSIRTQTVFYPRSWTFIINETWYCDDVDAARPVSYTGIGQTTLPLKCTSESGRTSCEADAVTVNGGLDTKTALVPYSIEDPLPTADGCTISSVVNPSWTISNFETVKSVASPSGAPSAVAFNMKLNTKVNLFDYPVYVTSRGGLEAANGWLPCTFGTGELPLAPKNCSFQYVEKTNTLAINADWACTDLDADNPIIFNGVATAKLPELHCRTDLAGYSRCGTTEGSSLVAEVSNVTWKTEHSHL